MKQQLSATIILLCIAFFTCSNTKAQTITVKNLITMTSLSKEDLVKYLQKNYSAVNKALPDSARDTWNCTVSTFGGVSFYSYTREINDNRISIILSMPYKELFDKLEQEVKDMKIKKAEDGVYENEKYLIFPMKTYDERGRDMYTVRVEAK